MIHFGSSWRCRSRASCQARSASAPLVVARKPAELRPSSVRANAPVGSRQRRHKEEPRAARADGRTRMVACSSWRAIGTDVTQKSESIAMAAGFRPRARQLDTGAQVRE